MKRMGVLICAVLLVLGIAKMSSADPYADKVVSYSMGSGGVYGDHRDRTNALGAPDYVTDRYDYTSLGWGGAIILQFTDNYLTTSGNRNKDLWIYEIGDVLEPTRVYVSQNGVNWINVGSVPGGTSGIDIDTYIGKGIVAYRPYNYVKLIDTNLHLSRSPWAGADIDAVRANSTVKPIAIVATGAISRVSVPEPAAILVLSTSLIGIAVWPKDKKK